MNKTVQNIGVKSADFINLPKHFIGKKLPSVWWYKGPIKPSVYVLLPFVKNKRNSGFTLLELMVTLFVALVLAGVAVPNMRGFAQNSRISSQTNDLVADFNFARSEAIKRGTSNVVVCKSSNPTYSTPTCNTTGTAPWESGRIIFVDANGDNQFTTVAPSDTLLRVRGPLEGVNTLRAAASSVTPNLSSLLAFTRHGLTTLAAPAGTDPPHHFKLCDDRGITKARGIAISTTGRTKIVRGPNFTENLTVFALACP